MRAFIIIRNYNNYIIISVVKHTGKDKDNLTQYMCICAQHFSATAPFNKLRNCLLPCLFYFCFVRLFFFSFLFLSFFLNIFSFLFSCSFQTFGIVVVCFFSFFFGWFILPSPPPPPPQQPPPPPPHPWCVSCFLGVGGGEGLVVCFVFSTSVACTPITPRLFPPFSPTVESIYIFIYFSSSFFFFFFFFFCVFFWFRFLLVSDFLGSFLNFIFKGYSCVCLIFGGWVGGGGGELVF